MNSPVPYNNNQLKESVNHTTAFICGNSLSTQYFLKYCIENTIEIPKEVSFIGFDNNGFTQLYKENLTKIKKPATHLGELAAYTILKRMNGDYSGFPVTISLPASIETGNSINLL